MSLQVDRVKYGYEIDVLLLQMKRFDVDALSTVSISTSLAKKLISHTLLALAHPNPVCHFGIFFLHSLFQCLSSRLDSLNNIDPGYSWRKKWTAVCRYDSFLQFDIECKFRLGSFVRRFFRWSTFDSFRFIKQKKHSMEPGVRVPR